VHSVGSGQNVIFLSAAEALRCQIELIGLWLGVGGWVTIDR